MVEFIRHWLKENYVLSFQLQVFEACKTWQLEFLLRKKVSLALSLFFGILPANSIGLDSAFWTCANKRHTYSSAAGAFRFSWPCVGTINKRWTLSTENWKRQPLIEPTKP